MDIIWQPQEIENKSMQIIEEYIRGHDYHPLEKDVVKRIIHTTGDPSIADRVKFGSGAVSNGLKALKKRSFCLHRCYHASSRNQ